MQRVLEKMAKKLNEYDEASLMQLWEHYAAITHSFEPTKRWEEAALAMCLVQAVRWKNQLFNYNLALTAAPPDPAMKETMASLPGFFKKTKAAAPEKAHAPQHKATVLTFPGGKNDVQHSASSSAAPAKNHKGSKKEKKGDSPENNG